MKPTLTRCLSLCLLTALAACGGSDPAAQVRDSYSALSSRDYAGAEAGFTEALKGLDASSTEHMRAQLGLFRARSYSDPAGAKADFLIYAQANGLAIIDYTQLISDLVSGDNLDEAIAVVAEMKTIFPDEPKVDEMGNMLVVKAKTSSNSGALDALSGLGYVGND
jgi:hypothetical protein